MMKSTAEIWTMIASEFSLRCAFALFHFLWQGTLLGIVAAVAMALLRNESASVRYWLSATGLFVCPLCVAATFCSMSPPRETHYRMNSVVAGQLASNAAGATNNSKETIVSRDNFELLVTDSNPEQSVSVFQTEKFLSVAFENLNLLLSKFSNFVLCIYAICVLALLLRLGTAIFGSSRLRLATWVLADPATLAILSERSRAIGVHNYPTVAYSHRVHVPIVVGLLRPMILLPASIATGIGPHEFAAIIGHELAHIRRHDLWLNLLQRLIESLLFFHPVVWYLSRRMSFERELCCDDLVIASGLQPMRYAEALLQVAALCSATPHKRSFALSVFGGRSTSFEMRVERMINLQEIPRVQLWRIASVLLLFPVLIAVTWTTAAQFLNSSLLQPKQSTAMPGPPVLQVEPRTVDEARENLREIDGTTAQLTIKYHIPGGEDTARLLVFDVERSTFLGTSNEFYGKGRINNVKNGSEIQFTDLKPGEHHVCRIAYAGQYTRTSLDRSTIHLKAGDARSIEITRPLGKHIVGRVINRNAFHLRHVQVWVCPALDDSIWRFRDATSHNICEEDGSFTTDLVSPGKYFVFVEGFERASEPVTKKNFVIPGFTGFAEITVPAEGEPKPVAIELKNMLEDPTWNGHAKGKQSLEFTERMNPSWGTEEQGLQFGISHATDRRGFREGDRIPFAMFVRNTSNESRLVSVSNDFDEEVVDLTDSGGKSMPVQKFIWFPSLVGGSFSSCFSEMLEPGEVMAFRLPGLGLALPPTQETQENETKPIYFGPAPDRPNWSAPTIGKYSLKQSKTIRFGTTDDHSSLSDIRLSTGSIQFEVLEKN
jgi:beta-lactamase regulating signal transducer with metallopeptidase domain